MRNTLLFSIVVILLSSCSIPKNGSIEDQKQAVKNDYRDTIIETDSTFEVGMACGVFFFPSDGELDSLKAEIGEEDFYTVMDDVAWYTSESSTFLEEKGIRVIHTSYKKVRFHLMNGMIQRYTNDSLIDWSPVLYDGKNTIKRADLVDISTGYNAVFK